MTIISPSILSADFANLERDVKRAEKAGADWLHVDVMDGHFVPNITIGVPVVASLKKVTKLPLDVHLMIENPENYVEPFARAGADIITFHYEAVTEDKKAGSQEGRLFNERDLGEMQQKQQSDNSYTSIPPYLHTSALPSINQIISAIHGFGIKAGMSIKPKTPADVVFPYLSDLDMVLVMTVEPGFGGQKFMEDCAEKIKIISEYTHCHSEAKNIMSSFASLKMTEAEESHNYKNLIIQVDGGINAETAKICKSYGANCLVAGNYIYKSEDIEKAILSLRNL